MDNLDKNIVYIDLTDVNSEKEYNYISEKVYSNNIDMSNFLKGIKEMMGCTKIYIWCPSMEIIFLGLNPTKTHEFTILDKSLKDGLMKMRHNSSQVKDIFEFKSNLVMVEPSRIKDGSDLTGEIKDLKMSTILSLKKKNVSKVWFWKTTMEIAIFKVKGINDLDFTSIDIKKDMFENVSLYLPEKKTIVQTVSKDKSKKSEIILDLNIILDKISARGIESLSKKEKSYLDNYKFRPIR